jgi:arginyl-tRNA synthetase
MDSAKTRYDHVGFGLVLQVIPGEEEKAAEPKPAEKKGAKKGVAEKAAEGKPAAEEMSTEEKEAKPEEKKGAESKKPKIGKMKTREGDSTKLMDLLDEAKNRTLAGFRERMKEDEEEV